jgi:transposase
MKQVLFVRVGKSLTVPATHAFEKKMDSTEFALKLIKAYKAEANRLRRALYAVNKNNTKWREQKDTRYNSLYIDESDKTHRDYFIGDGSVIEKTSFFISKNIKKRELDELDKWIEHNGHSSSSYLAKIKADREVMKNAPVLQELGKLWQAIFDAKKEKAAAYKARWEVRCAIKAFNKMDTGILIKFGRAVPNGGSMSNIVAVVIDGERIPLRRFLDNAEFETTLLKT